MGDTAKLDIHFLPLKRKTKQKKTRMSRDTLRAALSCARIATALLNVLPQGDAPVQRCPVATVHRRYDIAR
jgi:hypothetical protein